MHRPLRRTAVIIASSAVVLAGAPLVNSALADTVLTQATVTPADATTVTDSHPPISATYTDNGAAANLDPSSTITVSKGGTTSIGCSSVVSGNSIACSYSGLLSAGSYTIAVHAVEAANTSKTNDKSTTFTVNVPTRVVTNTSPAENSTVASVSAVVVNFDQAIDNQHSTISVQQIADRQPDGTYAPASHTPLTGTTDYPNDGQTLTMTPNNTATEIQFTPSSPPVNKGIYRVTVDVFGTNGDSSPTAAATENPKAETKDSYTFTLDNTPPAGATDLAVSPTPVTKANEAAITFSGNAKPGNTITVTVANGSSPKSSSPVTVSSTNCTSATSCPWSVPMDLTTVADGDAVAWTAKEQSSVGSTTVSGPTFVKNTSAPAGLTVHGAFPQSPTELEVTGGSDSTVDHYTIDISDSTSPTANKIPQIVLAKSPGGGVNADGTYLKDVDVSSLNDGVLTISVVAYDAYGNNAPASTGVDKESGVQLVFGSSFFKLVNSDTPSFSEVLNRNKHAIQKPSQLAIEFSNPITLVRHDTSTLNNTPSPNSGNHDTSASAPTFTEVLANGDGNVLQGTAVVDTSDPRRLLVTPPAGLADGSYKVHVSLWQANKCDWTDTSATNPSAPNFTPPACDPKWTYDNYVMEPGTTTPFVFTVDSVAPSTATITAPAGTVDGTNVGDVVVGGTGEAGTTLTLTAKSSSGGTVLALNQGQPVTVGNDGNWSDDESDAFTALPDGTITITGTPADSAGNVGTIVTHTFTLAARPSIPRALAVSTNDTSFTLHWTAPSYDGYPPVNGNAISHLTGYVYDYNDTTQGAADTSTHRVVISNPSATSVTQAGLLPGHKYDVELCALNNISEPCNPISTTATPAFRTAVTAHVNHALVVYGNSITLSGRLTRTDIGAGIASQALKITPRFDNGKFGTVIHVTTNSSGNWSVSFRPAKDALYIVTYNSPVTNSIYQPSNSSVRSLVRVSLRISRVTSRSTSHVYPVTVTGSILPNQSGRYVYIYAKAAGASHYQRIGTAKISSKSTWAFSKTFGKGKFYLYAYFPSQNGNVGGPSNGVTFTRS
jgi:hypothetical protein